MLNRFLASASIFADHILVSDESSGLDNTLNIYSNYPKVILHHNSGNPLGVDVRRNFLLGEARKFLCDKKIIISIDSDEILSANILVSNEWQTILNSDHGTLFHLQWVTLWKSFEFYKVDHPHFYGNYNRQIWIDDGISEIPTMGSHGMHIAYNPMNAKRHIYLNEIVCLHYQYCNWDRVESKHRFYRAKEKSIIKKLSNLAIYRIYGYMRSPKIRYRNCLTKWFDGWEKIGIDISSIEITEFTHFDLDVIEMFKKNGTDFFAFQDVWRVDWVNLIDHAKKMGKVHQDYVFIPPKKRFLTRLFHIYMRLTMDVKFIRYIERKLFHKNFLYD